MNIFEQKLIICLLLINSTLQEMHKTLIVLEEASSISDKEFKHNLKQQLEEIRKKNI